MIAISRLSSAAFAVSWLFLTIGVAQSSEKQPQQGQVRALQLSFKRDPRMIDPFRGVAPWVSGSNYVGAYAQDMVEARVEGLDAAGKTFIISAQWKSSDPEMVTVAPSQGDDVQIVVHREGKSKLTVSYQGISQELLVTAKASGKFIQFQITPAAAPQPAVTRIADIQSPLKTTKQEVSYAVGMNIGKALRNQSVEVDDHLLGQGLKDALAGNKTLLSDERAAQVLAGVQTDHRMLQAKSERQALADKNRRDGEAFLAANKQKEGVITLPSGLQYKIIKAGNGPTSKPTDAVTCHYRGSFVDGTAFDSKENVPVSFPVKAVIKGWQEALQLMSVGSKWQLFIPADLAYGEHGSGSGGGRRGGHGRQIIGPNTALVFDLELLSVQSIEEAVSRPVSTDEKPLDADRIEALRKALQVKAPE
jgi:FKBP-type peptidyl-prolyl cis-trans isomerase FklB